ncbi:MAG: ABC transporter ATP-binding protein [candidate division WOR-3 bacterium]|nr:ABC transporter ATP-binding protein [candidate division WOR-3 bacterium]
MFSIELKDITFRYRENEILSKISLTIKPGEFFGIIGPNGAGKTTLLKLIAGLLKPNSGEIKILGEALHSLALEKRAKLISYVPQENFFYFDFSVLDIVLMARHPYLKPMERPKKTDIEKALEALKITDALELKDRNIMEISSGERQRVVLARALASEPEILLLDEPTSYLDMTHQIEIIKILKRLNADGLTIVFLSHDINLTSLVCDRILLLHQGRVVACDEPPKVIIKEIIQNVYSISPDIIEHPKIKRPQIVLPY